MGKERGIRGSRNKGTFKIKLFYPGLDVKVLTGTAMDEHRTQGLSRVKVNYYAKLLL